MISEGADLRSLYWSRADIKAFRAREHASKNASVSDDSTVDTIASASSVGSIASALPWVDHVLSAATQSCSRCGGEHDPASCPHFGNEGRVPHPDGLPCPVLERTAISAYRPVHGRVCPMPADCDCVFWALAFTAGQSSRSDVRSTRAELADFVRDNPCIRSYGSDVTYADRSLEEFGLPLVEYAARMRHSWVYGGMFEIDAYSKQHHCRVVVYERASVGMFRVISACEVPGFTSTRHLLYDPIQKHFDVLAPNADGISDAAASSPAAAAADDGSEAVN